MRTHLIALAALTCLSNAAPAAPGLSLSHSGAAAGPGKFAAEEIRREASARGMSLLEADEKPSADSFTITLDLADPAEKSISSQSYRIRVAGENGHRSIKVTGTDPAGVMYGGLDIAEAIRTGTLATLKDSDHTPHIAQRGIKMNPPLDLRTPSYSDPSDASQANIPEMWSMDFWRETFDDMARHRYNVISLWSLNPFPSIVKVPEFPNVALDDVWRTKVKLDGEFSGTGLDFVRPEMLANHEVVKTMTIDQKIKFWQDVMQLAKDRGIDVYWFLWNIYLYGAEGKDGITGDKLAPRTIEYFRASVRETIKTYPLLAGFGITAGEGFPKGMKSDEKEKWLWETYGEGIRDGLKDTPNRKFRLIHRFHMTGLGEIQQAFSELPCELDLSFKYAIAHMYSVPAPSMIKPVLPLLSPELRCWLTIRNDDIYSFRWADFDYARDFIKAIPPKDKIAGFYMGCDRYPAPRNMPPPSATSKRWPTSVATTPRRSKEPVKSRSSTRPMTIRKRPPVCATLRRLSATGRAIPQPTPANTSSPYSTTAPASWIFRARQNMSLMTSKWRNAGAGEK